MPLKGNCYIHAKLPPLSGGALLTVFTCPSSQQDATPVAQRGNLLINVPCVALLTVPVPFPSIYYGFIGSIAPSRLGVYSLHFTGKETEAEGGGIPQHPGVRIGQD